MSADDFIAYIAATAGHPAFTARFREDLCTPGLRIPITADAATFIDAAEIGRTVIWLHTFGERMANPDLGRPAQPPRLSEARRPRIPANGAIPEDPADMPDEMRYDATTKPSLTTAGGVHDRTAQPSQRPWLACGDRAAASSAAGSNLLWTDDQCRSIGRRRSTRGAGDCEARTNIKTNAEPFRLLNV